MRVEREGSCWRVVFSDGRLLRRMIPTRRIAQLLADVWQGDVALAPELFRQVLARERREHSTEGAAIEAAGQYAEGLGIPPIACGVVKVDGEFLVVHGPINRAGTNSP